MTRAAARAARQLAEVRAMCDGPDPIAALAAIRLFVTTAPIAAAALGAIRSAKKAASSRANGAKGGRPPRRPAGPELERP